MALHRANKLYGCRLHAVDGEIGALSEFYFDDQHWTVRYLVVDVGNWLTGRQVLIAPTAIVQTDWAAQNLRVNLTTSQIKESPRVDTEKPVSRQQEEEIVKYYRWPLYWGMTPAATGAYSQQLSAVIAAHSQNSPSSAKGDPHLRRTREVTGYYIQASDGDIGHVEDFILDDETWTIRYMLVDTRNWWPGKKVLISPHWIVRVNWAEKSVHTRASRDAVRNSPEYATEAAISREYEERLNQHYEGRENPR